MFDIILFFLIKDDLLIKVLNPIVSLKKVSFSRDDHLIFSDLSFDIVPGTINVIMGPSGTGKTTLVRLMTGQLQPCEGEVEVFQQPLSALSAVQLRGLRQQMGILFQQGGLFTDLTVFENVAFPLRQHTDLTERMIRDLVMLMLNAVGLSESSQLRVEELSGGMVRRASLARAIVMSPQIVFYDEPFAGQDPVTKGLLLKLIKHLNQVLNITSVVVSHDVVESLDMADKVIMLSGGRLIASGTPAEVQALVNEEAQQFLKGLSEGPLTQSQVNVKRLEELL